MLPSLTAVLPMGVALELWEALLYSASSSALIGLGVEPRSLEPKRPAHLLPLMLPTAFSLRGYPYVKVSMVYGFTPSV